jgi:hypothetical protein
MDSFREPLLVKVPFPPWALRGPDAIDDAPKATTAAEFDDL